MQPSCIGLDPEGFIRPVADGNSISPPYQPVVDTLRTSWYQRAGLPIHGLYLAGSVAAGSARPYASDLDITLLLTAAPTADLRQTLAGLSAELRTAYPLVPKVDLVLVTLAAALDQANRYSWGFWFQHCCVCIAGADITPTIPPFQPSLSLSLGLNGDIQAYCQRVQSQLGAASPEQRQSVGRALARKLVRTAFGLVSVAERSWTDDLAVATQLFVRHHPAHAPTIEPILELAQKTCADASALIPAMLEFGQWLPESYRALKQE